MGDRVSQISVRAAQHEALATFKKSSSITEGCFKMEEEASCTVISELQGLLKR